MRRDLLRGICLLALVLFFHNALGHPGGRDSEGCHVCRTRCEQYGLAAGERHCHSENSPIPVQDDTAEIMRLDYEGFTVWLDCARRGAVKFR